MKVETYLRMAEIPYQAKVVWPSQAPKMHLPFIKNEDTGEVIADSTLILNYLKKTFNVSLGDGYSKADLATGLAFQKLLEDHLYYVGLYIRWVYPPGWKISEPGYFGGFKGLKRYYIPKLARRMTQKRLLEQGMGFNSEEEVFALGIQGLGAVSDFLGEKPFFLGESPSSIDATALSFLSSLTRAPIESPLKAFSRERPHLKRYCDRLMEKYYPEYASATKA